MTTTTTNPKAETGRRVTFTFHADLENPGTEHPGIITGITGSESQPVLKIRLDGARSNLDIRSNNEGLRLLDEVTAVPELPMGRFIPAASNPNGFTDRAGVLVAVIGEDGEELVVITDDRDKAVAAATEYLREVGIDDPDDVQGETKYLTPKWAVFEWQPEDAEMPWTVSWAAEGDDQAIRVFYLPA